MSLSGSRDSRKITAHIVEASKSGLRIGTDTPIDLGIVVKIEWENTIVMAETRHCRQTGPGTYSVGLKISEVLGHGKLRTQSGAA